MNFVQNANELKKQAILTIKEKAGESPIRLIEDWGDENYPIEIYNLPSHMLMPEETEDNVYTPIYIYSVELEGEVFYANGIDPELDEEYPIELEEVDLMSVLAIADLING